MQLQFKAVSSTSSPSHHQQDQEKSERGGSQFKSKSKSKSNSALNNVMFACHGNMRCGFHRVWVGAGPASARNSPLAEMFCGEGARDSGGILAQTPMMSCNECLKSLGYRGRRAGKVECWQCSAEIMSDTCPVGDSALSTEARGR